MKLIASREKYALHTWKEGYLQNFNFSLNNKRKLQEYYNDLKQMRFHNMKAHFLSALENATPSGLRPKYSSEIPFSP
jgi:hypothetical protein